MRKGDRTRAAEVAAEALASVDRGGDVALIGTPVRVVIATVLNRLIDIPLLNEAQEQARTPHPRRRNACDRARERPAERRRRAQVIFLKIVDVVADALERELRRIPQLDALRDPSKRRELRDDLVRTINAAVDLPLLNEEQEAVAIGARRAPRASQPRASRARPLLLLPHPPQASSWMGCWAP